MNIQEYKKIFPILRKHKIVPFLHGNQGIGKTQINKQLSKELGLDFIHLHLATQEVGDLVGLLKHNADGTVTHARPEWFPTSGEGVIFLDELNRAHPEVLQAMFSFITEGTIHQHKLPSGWNIVAAGNYQNGDFTTTDMSDAAWLSRFCHIDLKPTVEEFILYAEDNNAFEIAGFIRENGECLERKAKGDNINFVTPDRRAWMTMIAPLETEASIENERFELYQGCIGTSAASAFLTYKNKKEKAVSGNQVLTQYEKVRSIILGYSDPKNSRNDMITKTSTEILSKLAKDPSCYKDEKLMNNLKQYILDIPKEGMLTFLNTISKQPSVEKFTLLNDKKFNDMLRQREQAKGSK